MNKKDIVPVIAVDGPGGSGKGTITTRLAAHLGWHFLDSGALYRLAALAVRLKMRWHWMTRQRWVRLTAGLDIRFEMDGESVRALLDQEDVSNAIRQEETGVVASRISAVPAVRAALAGRQRRFGSHQAWWLTAAIWVP